jgi:hypothetical protein
MKGALQDAALSPRQRSEKVFDLIADFLLRAIAKDPAGGQVAILLEPPRGGNLRFAYPSHLARGNFVAIDRDCIAGRVFLDQAPLVVNDVPEVPHQSFFERIPNERGRIAPIQKMVASPIPGANDKTVGVVEVSRTGQTRRDAGDDFTPGAAENLRKTCRAVAPFILRVWTPE